MKIFCLIKDLAMSQYLAFACKSGNPDNISIGSNDFTGGPDSLLALGPIPDIFISLDANISVYKIFFSINGVYLIAYGIVDRNAVRMDRYITSSFQPTEITFTNNPISVCDKQITNSIGVVIRVIEVLPKEFRNRSPNQLTTGNQYAISVGTNPSGNLSAQVIITRSRSSALNV